MKNVINNTVTITDAFGSVQRVHPIEEELFSMDGQRTDTIVGVGRVLIGESGKMFPGCTHADYDGTKGHPVARLWTDDGYRYFCYNTDITL